MIQKFNIDINTVINNKSISYLNPLTLDEFTKLEEYLSNHLNISDYHYHNDILCESPIYNYAILRVNYFAVWGWGESAVQHFGYPTII